MFPFLAAIPVIGELLEKVLDRIPDPVAREKAAVAMQQALAETDLEVIRGQLEIDKAEASNPSVFVSGWRPFIGWVGGLGLAYQFVVFPIMTWASRLWNMGTPPDLDAGQLMALVTAMLGLGAYRTYEKTKGVADPQSTVSRAAAVARK
jgi:hypothetical protein